MNLGSDSFSSSTGAGKGDAELRAFLQKESQAAQINAMIGKLNDVCWDTCVDKPREKMDSRTESCISNCVGRFIDTSVFIITKFQQKAASAAGRGSY